MGFFPTSKICPPSNRRERADLRKRVLFSYDFTPFRNLFNDFYPKTQAQKRIAELDRIFKRIYEDDISGTISHDRFLKLSAEYEVEQRELEEKVKSEQQEVDTYEQNKSDFDSFIAIIRKYVGNKGTYTHNRQ